MLFRRLKVSAAEGNCRQPWVAREKLTCGLGQRGGVDGNFAPKGEGPCTPLNWSRPQVAELESSKWKELASFRISTDGLI